LAQDKVLGVEVGLKLLTREDPEFDQAQEFFQQEAISAMKLRHPQILGVFLFGKTENNLYLVQEPFSGESLLAHFGRHQRFTLAQALHLLEQMSAALAFAHEQHFIHQALNPLQVLVKGEEVRVANFALPGVTNEQAAHLELKAYNPPEVIGGEPVTPPGNVFSLGVLGFRLVAGSLPYPLTFDEPFPYRLETPPVDLEEIPLSLQNILLQCLALEPEERFQDAGAFLVQLKQVREEWGPGRREQWLGWEPERPRQPWPAVARAADLGGKIWATGKSWAQTLGEVAREKLPDAWAKISQAPRRLWWGLGLTVVIILLLWAGNKMRGRPTPPPAPPVAAGPVKLPAVGAGPPLVETAEPMPGTEPDQVGPPAAPQPPAAAPAAPAEAKPAPREERYLIVAATSAKEEPARSLSQRLKSKNYNAKVIKKTSGAKTVYQVQLGPLTGQKQAEELARRLKTQEKLNARVQKLPARGANSQPSRRPER
jgi:cell division septation protein DedD